MDVENVFSYHAPFGNQADRYAALREKAKEFASLIILLTPASREQSLALTNLQQAVMWANAAIAINEKPPLAGDSSRMPLDDLLAHVPGPCLAICDTCGYRTHVGNGREVMTAWLAHDDEAKHPHVPGKGATWYEAGKEPPAAPEGQ